MRILAIETSCDDTAVSLVEAGGDLSAPQFTVLAHEVSSQTATHAAWGGVVPALAKREHGKNLVPLLTQVLTKVEVSEDKPEINKIELEKILEREVELKDNLINFLSKTPVPKIDAIAVTQGPGLEPALWVGLNAARALALAWGKPLIPANHLEGHIISPLTEPITIKFPALALIVSGGHTELDLVHEWGKYEQIGATRDDAVGEAFDKVARLMGLSYPGGPEISRLASYCQGVALTEKWQLPRPMIDSPDFDFSFSGLKTAVRYAIEKHGEMSEKDKQTLAHEFQNAVIDVLTVKTKKALEQFNIQTLIIGGGVVANVALRESFTNLAKENNLTLLLPNQALSTDNATMIAMAAYIRYLKNEFIAPDQIPSADTLIARGTLPLTK